MMIKKWMGWSRQAWRQLHLDIFGWYERFQVCFKIVALCAANMGTLTCVKTWIVDIPIWKLGLMAIVSNCHYMLLQLPHIDLQAQIGCCKLDNSQICTNVILVTYVLTTCLVSLVVVNYQCFLLMSCITVVFVSVLLSGLLITVRIFTSFKKGPTLLWLAQRVASDAPAVPSNYYKWWRGTCLFSLDACI
jgi:hypothetical protein